MTFALLFIVGLVGAFLFVQFNRKESLIDLGIFKNYRFVFLAPIWSKTFPEIGAKTAPIKAPGNINRPATDELNPAET